MPDRCALCHPLPEDWDARQEAIWRHAVAQFVDQSGVDVSGVPRADVALLVRSWVLASNVAVLDRELVDATSDGRRPPPRFETRSFRFALALMMGVLACLLMICAGVWRFFS
jgi:hypothetical protein